MGDRFPGTSSPSAAKNTHLANAHPDGMPTLRPQIASLRVSHSL
jgi:hypothetical protein